MRRLLRQPAVSPGLIGVAALIGLTGLTGGCTPGDVDPGLAYLSPLDGQTGWDPAVPLVVVAEDMDIPPDYPLPPLIRVTDLARGGFVAGRTERLQGSLRFTPDEPFAPDARYGWVVDVPEPVAHGPTLAFPEQLQEPAVFATADTLEVLDGTLVEVPDGDPLACLVLSRKTDQADQEPWTLEVDGETVEAIGTLADPAEWAVNLEFPQGDPGVDVICFEGLQGSDPEGTPFVEPGDRVRLYWGDSQWVVDDIGTAGITATVQDLRRATPTGGDE